LSAATATPAVAAERRRIARELHDVVGHSLSLMVIGAQALGAGADDEARRVGDSIASLGREAMTELARTLEQLRPDEEARPGRAPALAEVPTLVERARWAGLAAELRIEGAPRPVPAAVDLCGYRIVQEALTNVVRHAEARRATVTVRYGVDAIGLEVVDDGAGPPPGSPTLGHGLLGMCERAALAGGSLAYGRREGGGFRVAALLPAGR
jgi:signal transduction histidine kinase